MKLVVNLDNGVTVDFIDFLMQNNRDLNLLCDKYDKTNSRACENSGKIQTHQDYIVDIMERLEKLEVWKDRFEEETAEAIGDLEYRFNGCDCDLTEPSTDNVRLRCPACCGVEIGPVETHDSNGALWHYYSCDHCDWHGESFRSDIIARAMLAKRLKGGD